MLEATVTQRKQGRHAFGDQFVKPVASYADFINYYPDKFIDFHQNFSNLLRDRPIAAKSSNFSPPYQHAYNDPPVIASVVGIRRVCFYSSLKLGPG